MENSSSSERAGPEPTRGVSIPEHFAVSRIVTGEITRNEAVSLGNSHTGNQSVTGSYSINSFSTSVKGREGTSFLAAFRIYMAHTIAWVTVRLDT